jgi:hypothetical protein
MGEAVWLGWGWRALRLEHGAGSLEKKSERKDTEVHTEYKKSNHVRNSYGVMHGKIRPIRHLALI